VIDGSHLQVVAEKVGCARFEWVGQAHVARDDPNSFLRQQTGSALNKYGLRASTWTFAKKTGEKKESQDKNKCATRVL
jgi:hypothetical protein